MPDNQSKLDYFAYLEACGFGHVVAQISEFWFLPDAETRFRNLLVDSDRGDRRGFPPEAYKAIMKLYTIYCFENNCLEHWADLYVQDKKP